MLKLAGNDPDAPCLHAFQGFIEHAQGYAQLLQQCQIARWPDQPSLPIVRACDPPQYGFADASLVVLSEKSISTSFRNSQADYGAASTSIEVPTGSFPECVRADFAERAQFAFLPQNARAWRELLSLEKLEHIRLQNCTSAIS